MWKRNHNLSRNFQIKRINIVDWVTMWCSTSSSDSWCVHCKSHLRPDISIVLSSRRRSLSSPPPPSCSSSGDKCKIREFQNSTDQLPVLKEIRFKSRDILDSQCRLSVTVTLAIIHHSQKRSPPPQRNLGDDLHSYYKMLLQLFHRFMNTNWREPYNGISLQYNVQKTDLDQ